jgi:hypothetical protein
MSDNFKSDIAMVPVWKLQTEMHGITVGNSYHVLFTASCFSGVSRD